MGNLHLAVVKLTAPKMSTLLMFSLVQFMVFLSCLSAILCFGMDTTCQYKPDGLYRHGSSCKRFIHCAHGRPFYKVCPIFMEFNERTKVCDVPANAKCNVRLAAAVKSTSGKNLCRSGKYTVVGVPDDCRSYIVCINGKQIKKKCPTGLRFHPKYKVCVYGKPTDCVKSPLCLKLPDGMYNHPKTCKSYITCNNGVTLVKDCPPLMVFDSIKKRCGWKWNSLCKVGDSKDTPNPHKTNPQVTTTPAFAIENVSPPIKTENSPNNVKWEKAVDINVEDSRHKNAKIVPTTLQNTPSSIPPTVAASTIKSTISPIDILQRFKFAVAQGNGFFNFHKGSRTKTYVISGQGYPAVPVKDKRYDLIEKLRTMRISLHPFKTPDVYMKRKDLKAPIKILDISYESSTLQPFTYSKVPLSKKARKVDDPGTKAKQELTKYIKTMNAQVNLFSRRLTKASDENSVQKSAVKDIDATLRHRKVLSRLLKNFLKDKLQKFEPTYPEASKGPSGTRGPRYGYRARPEMIHKGSLDNSDSGLTSLRRLKANGRTAKRLENQQGYFVKETDGRALNPRLPDLQNREGFVVSKPFRDKPRYANVRQRSQRLFDRRKTGRQIRPTVHHLGLVPRDKQRLQTHRLKSRSKVTHLSLQSRLNTICSTVFDPVCGSDFQTYFNDCHLALTSCSRDKSKSIQKLHDGPCVTKAIK